MKNLPKEIKKLQKSDTRTENIHKKEIKHNNLMASFVDILYHFHCRGSV